MAAGAVSTTIGNGGNIDPMTGKPYVTIGPPVSSGPTPQQVLDAGGTYGRTGAGPDTYSLPIGRGGGTRTDPNDSMNTASLNGLIAAMGHLGGQPNITMPPMPGAVNTPTFTYHGLQDTGGGGGSSPVQGVAPVDTSGAERAAFARAKDQTGQAATGAMAGLRSALGGRGMLGSGGESRGIQSIAGRGLGELGDVSRQQAIDASGLAERTATTNYQGGIAQRGQDVTKRGQDVTANTSANEIGAGMAKTGYEGAINQRGQDIQAQQAAAKLAFDQAQLRQQQQLEVLKGLMGAMGKGRY